MQPSSDTRRVSASSETKSVTEANDDTQALPPSYPSAVFKLKNLPSPSFDDRPPPPSYLHANDPTVVYINNYPGPPLTDGVVQINTSGHAVGSTHGVPNIPLSRKMRLYLSITGGTTIVLGLVIIGIQVGLVASHSAVHYYYGFWAGVLIISIGICTILFNNRFQTNDTAKYFRSSLWQTVFVAVVFGFGVIIIVTDSCDEGSSSSDENENACTPSYEILNGFLIAAIALTFVQSIINTVVIAVLKRRYVTMLNATT